MSNREGFLRAPSEAEVALTTSKHGSFTIFGLAGEHRKAAVDLTEDLENEGHQVHFLSSEKDGRPEGSPSIQYYGVWPHIGQKAIAAMSSRLGVDIVDQRDPEVMRGNALPQMDTRNVIPVGGVGRAA